MLALVSIFLLTLIASMFVIWLYRLLIGWHHYTQSQVDRPRSAAWLKIATQQGFMSFISAPKEPVRRAKLSRPTGNIKSPWGW